MRNNNEVVMAGSYPGKVEWPGYAGPHPNHGNNQNYDVFITSFNAHTGAVNDVDTLGGVFGGFDEPTCIVADRNNNVYLGGRYGGSLYVGTADTLQLTGGQSDFFIMKHGYASCMPVTVEEVKATNEIVVYPNPATELLQVKGLQETTNYRLLSITGSVMQTGVLEQNNKGISTSHLTPGMYLLELNNTQQHGVVRVLKQ
ncbi:MAG: T9SS type A sorting domain-containing protein [Flavipsychrobacter sp.]|nr:T9SS type A sorting domain-containing protein [Flavipsychrobacter sp.]